MHQMKKIKQLWKRFKNLFRTKKAKQTDVYTEALAKIGYVIVDRAKDRGFRRKLKQAGLLDIINSIMHEALHETNEDAK